MKTYLQAYYVINHKSNFELAFYAIHVFIKLPAGTFIPVGTFIACTKLSHGYVYSSGYLYSRL